MTFNSLLVLSSANCFLKVNISLDNSAEAERINEEESIAKERADWIEEWKRKASKHKKVIILIIALFLVLGLGLGLGLPHFPTTTTTQSNCTNKVCWKYIPYLFRNTMEVLHYGSRKKT